MIIIFQNYKDIHNAKLCNNTKVIKKIVEFKINKTIFIIKTKHIYMFREMRRKKQALSEEECIDILINEPRGVLAVLGDNDYPYAVPLSHAYIDGKIYFHGTKKESHLRDSIEKHDKVSFCVLDKGVKSDSWWYTFRSVIVFGRMKTIDDEDLKIEKLTHFGNKFFPTEEETKSEIDKLLDVTELYEITIEHMSGKIVKEK